MYAFVVWTSFVNGPEEKITAVVAHIVHHLSSHLSPLECGMGGSERGEGGEAEETTEGGLESVHGDTQATISTTKISCSSPIIIAWC